EQHRGDRGKRDRRRRDHLRPWLSGHPAERTEPPEVAQRGDQGGEAAAPDETPRRHRRHGVGHGSGVPGAFVPTTNVTPFALRYIARSTTGWSGGPADSTSTPAARSSGRPTSASSSGS